MEPLPPSPSLRPLERALQLPLAALALAFASGAACLAGDAGVYFRDGGYPDAGPLDSGPDSGPDAGPADSGPVDAGGPCLTANAWSRAVAPTLFTCTAAGDVPCGEEIDITRGGTWTATADTTAGAVTHVGLRWTLAGMVRDLQIYQPSGLQAGSTVSLITVADAGIPDGGVAIFDEALNELPERLGVPCNPMGGSVRITALAFPDAGTPLPAHLQPSVFSALYTVSCIRAVQPHVAGCVSFDAAAPLLDGGPQDAGAVPLPPNDGVTLGSLTECAAKNSAYVDGDPGDGLHPGIEYFDFHAGGSSTFHGLNLQAPTFIHFEQRWSPYPLPYTDGIFELDMDGSGNPINLGQIYTSGTGSSTFALHLHDVACTVDESQFQLVDFATVVDSGGVTHISKLTATYLQHCAGSPGFLRGCLHMEP